MTTSSLLSTPPLRITPVLACLLRRAVTSIVPLVVRLIGDTGRLLLPCLLEVRNGFVKSALPFVGDVFEGKVFKAGVKGAFASERERCRP